jgi:DOPA 4,5-dioxygenase
MQIQRTQIQNEINEGFLRGCYMDSVNYGPHGPHPVGNFQTCCNSSSISHGVSWFTQNRGNLSIFFHPLTRWEIIDHTDRAMFMGKSLPLDLSFLSHDLGEPRKCLPIPGT